MAQTLAELKAQNATEEAELIAAPEPVVKEVEIEAVEVEPEELDEGSEPKPEEPEEATAEPWQIEEDEQASEDGSAKFGDSDIAAAKRKLRAKLERKHSDELAELKAENETLRRGGSTAAAQPQQAAMPTLESCDYDEANYSKSLQAWIQGQVQAGQSTSQVSDRQSKAQQAQESAVDDHYSRAAKLAKETGISDEVYHRADLAVRQAVESAFPDKGDMITDQFIYRLGIGSDKVMYYLGRNQRELDVFKGKLSSDPSGIEAATYLGELKGRVATPQKKVTKAPAPAARAEGGDGHSTGGSKLMKKYQATTDMQARFDLKRQAKTDGIDVSKW
jgi:hypothetical protein